MEHQEYALHLIDNLKQLIKLKTNACKKAEYCAIINRQESCLFLAKYDNLLNKTSQELELKSKILEEKEKELTEREKNLNLLEQHLDKILTTKN